MVYGMETCFYSSFATCSLFTELLCSSGPPNKSSSPPQAPFVQQSPVQTQLQGTDGARDTAGLMLGPTYFWGRSEVGARAAVWAHSTRLQAARVSRQ